MPPPPRASRGSAIHVFLVYLFFAVTYFCWSVDVFVVIVVVAVCLFFMLSLFYVAARFQASTS